MDFDEAIAQVIDDAGRVVLPGKRIDVVTRVERDFARKGYCDHELIEVIEEVLRRRLAGWSRADKRGIWKSLATFGAIDETDSGFDDHTEDSVDMTLEGELMYLIIEQLSPPDNRRRRRDEDDAGEEDDW